MQQSKICKYGYRWIYKPEHPNTWRSYVMEHRLVMEEYLGRYLSRKEIIHHINEDRLDNRLENLQLMTRSEHMKIHHIRKNCQTTKEILQEMLDTMTVEKVCEHFNVNKTIIKRWREELGITEFNRKNKFRKVIISEEDMLSLLNEYKGINDVARYLGVSYCAVSRFIEEHRLTSKVVWEIKK